MLLFGGPGGCRSGLGVEIVLKRAYEAAEEEDGLRVLVDRLWPRGKSKEELRLGVWAKELPSSTELRKWFGHDPERWAEFCKRYEAELKAPEAREGIGRVVRAARGYERMTLVYAAKDTVRNEAVVLQGVFRREVKTLRDG